MTRYPCYSVKFTRIFQTRVVRLAGSGGFSHTYDRTDDAGDPDDW